MNDLLKKELIRDEGKRSTSYPDSVGLYTIGIGHMVGVEDRILKLTEDEITAFYNWDVATAEARCVAMYPNYALMDDARKRALVNMSFNLGGRLHGFTKFNAAIIGEDWMRAGAEMEDSFWWKQVGERAKRLRKMVEDGTA